MKRVTILLLFAFIFMHMSAQEEKELVHFIILDHRYNDEDLTDFSLDKENYISISVDDENNISMSNITSEGQSYGKMTRVQHERIEKTENGNKLDWYSFRWSYSNTYDTDKGSCFVQLIISYRDQANIFDLKMIDESLNSSVYRGYIEGIPKLNEYINIE